MSEIMTGGLSFEALREANQARCPMFKNAKGETKHSGSDWTQEDWFVATFGEIGEAANILKKVRRGDFSVSEIRDKLAREFSDIVIYLDLLAVSCDVTLDSWGNYSFNDVRMATRRIATYKTETLNSMMFQLATKMGVIGSVMMTARTTTGMKQGLANQMTSVLYCVDTLADMCGVDLGEAVKQTFNAKSQQLELPLFLTNFGPITELPPMVKSLPE